MSALPPKADIDRACRDVRFVPKADIIQLGKRAFDHLVRGSTCVLAPPIAHGTDDRAEIAALCGEDVLGPRGAHRIEAPLDHAIFFKRPQAFRQRIRGNAFQRVLQLLKAPWTVQKKVPQDKAGPTRTDDADRAGHWALKCILIRHVGTLCSHCVIRNCSRSHCYVIPSLLTCLLTSMLLVTIEMIVATM